jgi:phage repressor protein C with HTH and peptisase S24 domain/transcriptional regulator with XRE-family HTH domain
MEAIGVKLRRQRRRLGLTLDDLSGRTGISKPYLSLIETGRVPNPPSDEKLRRLEQSLGFASGELISQAHLQRTPRDIRVMLTKLMQEGTKGLRHEGTKGAEAQGQQGGDGSFPSVPSCLVASVPSENNLDAAYLSGVLHELVDKSAGNVEAVTTNSVPVINRVSAGYPEDFTDLSYPRGVADDYVGCPDINDKDSFAARVHGDSMTPKYVEGDIVIFSPELAPRDGDDCFVRFESGHTTFKRVFFEKDEAGASVIRLQPRNEKYRPQIVPADQISGLYKAIYRYQRVD